MTVEFELEVAPHAPGELLVLGFDLDESLSTPFELEVLAAIRPETDVDPQALPGAQATFAVHLADGSDRLVHGVVVRVRSWSEGRDENRRRLRIRIAPRLWTLGQIRRSRVFQRLTVPQIVKKVLDEARVESRTALSGSHPIRDYCVQYGESDLDFVSRLLEEEGVFYVFEHDAEKETVVLADANSACAPIPGDARVVFRERSEMASNEDHVDAFAAQLEVRPAAVAVRDFDYLRPSVDLTATATAEGDSLLEVYEYPAGHLDTAAGKTLARIRLEELRASREVMSAESAVRRFAAGTCFELDEHPLSTLNDKYLLVGIRHRGRQPEVLASGDSHADGEERYRNEARCIRAGVPFRPERRTRRPVIPGPQTAIVVGPSGEEIFTDQHGRVKVQFHWDREGSNDENSSCWVRVTQAWAGPGWGALYLPRIGQEVVVEFLEGDPDRPVITGAVYNGMNPPPIDLPGDKTRSTLKSASTPGSNGSNELRFEDASGSEHVYFHAQRDLEIVVENDKTQTVGGNERLTVRGNRARKIDGNQTLHVGGNEQITIGAAQEIDVGANRTTTVGANDTLSVVADHSTAIGGALSLNVGAASVEAIGAAKSLSVGGAYSVAVGGALNETVGGSKSEDTGGAKAETVGGKKTERIGGSRTTSVGGDLTETVAGKRTLKVTKDLVLNVGGKLQHSVTKEYIVKAKAISVSAADEMTLKVGKATLTLMKSGDVAVKGKKIEVKAKGNVVLKGMKISQN